MNARWRRVSSSVDKNVFTHIRTLYASTTRSKDNSVRSASRARFHAFDTIYRLGAANTATKTPQSAVRHFGLLRYSKFVHDDLSAASETFIIFE